MSKHIVQHEVHANMRAIERYGVILCDDDAADMASQVQEGRGIFLRKKKWSSISVWIVWWEEARRLVPVYYDRNLKKVVTILPLVAVHDRFAVVDGSKPRESHSIHDARKGDEHGRQSAD